MNRLLGFGGPYSPQVNGLLGIDPQEMRKQALYNGLANAGFTLMATNDMGDVGAAALLGVNQGRQRYIDDAITGYRLNQDVQEAERRRQEEADRAAALEMFPPQMRPVVKAYPQLGQDYFKSKYVPDQDSYYAAMPIQNADGSFTYAQPSKGGNIRVLQPPNGGRFLMPGEVAESKSRGNLEGEGPKYIVKQYVEKVRPAMEQTNDALTAISAAETMLANTQTGSGAELIQALRGWGATVGVNVDERVLSDTQAYQNFISQTVLPRMQALGGNDSNEELRYLKGTSGGDITQSRQAIAATLSLTRKLLENRMASYRNAEEVALPYLGGLESVPLVPQFPPLNPNGGGGGAPDLSGMSDAELEAIINGR